MTIINEKKERVEIVVYTYIRSGRCEYRISDILITPFRKRKALSVAAMIRDRYEYRKLGYDERLEYVHQEFLKYCTEEQIAQAVQEAYEKLKPDADMITYHVT